MIDALVLLAYFSLLVELLLFPVPSVASTVQLLRRPAKNGLGRDLHRARSLSPIKKILFFVLPTGLCVFLFLVPLLQMLIPSLRPVFHPIESLERPWIAWTGVAVCWAGRVMTFYSVLSIRGRDRVLFHPAVPAELRRGGALALSRNPGLVGMFIFYLGLIGVMPSAIMVAGIPLYFGNMHVRVRLEENNLEKRFSDSYRSFKLTTRRYL